MTQYTAAWYKRIHKNGQERSIDAIWGSAFAAGLERHAIRTEQHPYPQQAIEVPNADFHFCWSLKHPVLLAHCRATNTPIIALDHGYTPDRRVAEKATLENQQRVVTSLNLNGLNGESEFDTSAFAQDNSRCERYGWHITPRKESGDTLIIIGQVTGDFSLDALEGRSIYPWVRDKIAALRTEGVGPIVFKPHPLEDQSLIPNNLGVPIYTGDMTAVFRDASRVVTYSSTAGVDAALRGVPATADSPVSMIHEAQNRLHDPNRAQQWLNTLSFRQFRLDEIRSGLAWAILGPQVMAKLAERNPRRLQTAHM